MIEVLFILVVIGVLLYFINIIPMKSELKTIINVLAILFTVFWLFSILFPGLMHYPPVRPLK